MNERSDIRYYGTFKPERYAVGIALLSLDLVVPLQSCLRLAPIDFTETRHALRQAIIQNRQSLQKEPAVDPDLRSHVRSLLDTAASGRIEGWLDRSFIYRPDDFQTSQCSRRLHQEGGGRDEISVPDRELK